ncbi:CBO0543 family protein [Peribacillus loiseleuriae]|uniref:CBO0543 family protein n=1 Tax=Peribacillus loiseleuriae TaxID=1679170 RepID=UPI0037F4F325
MNIAKHSKDLNSRQSQKRRFPDWIKNSSNFLPSILLASLLGTYLDLYFIGKGFYCFPIRPMSTVFSINIAFTLIGLPLLIGVFLYACNKMNSWGIGGLIIILSLLMAVGEKQAETFGLFVHSVSWNHIYSLIGYIPYLTFIYSLYCWSKPG